MTTELNLNIIKAEIEQIIDQLNAIAIGAEQEIAIRNVADTLVTATDQIKHIVDPDWFKR